MSIYAKYTYRFCSHQGNISFYIYSVSCDIYLFIYFFTCSYVVTKFFDAHSILHSVMFDDIFRYNDNSSISQYSCGHEWHWYFWSNEFLFFDRFCSFVNFTLVLVSFYYYLYTSKPIHIYIIFLFSLEIIIIFKINFTIFMLKSINFFTFCLGNKNLANFVWSLSRKCAININR